MNQVFINPSRKWIWKWCISWKLAKVYEKPDHLCMNEASRKGPHCNGEGLCSCWLPCNNTPGQQQEGCISHSFLYMNSPINWEAYYHLRFIVIVNFVAAEWNKTQQLGTSSQEKWCCAASLNTPSWQRKKVKGDGDRKKYGGRGNTWSCFHAVHCSIASKNLSGSDLWPFYVPEFSPDFQQ